MALEITSTNISGVLASNELTVLDFWAPWCGPCRILVPIIEEIASENTNDKIAIGKLNVDEHGEIATKYGIRGIPSVLFFKNGELVDRMVGVKTKDELTEKINSLV